jgi:hypothetical protein
MQRTSRDSFPASGHISDFTTFLFDALVLILHCNAVCVIRLLNSDKYTEFCAKNRNIPVAATSSELYRTCTILAKNTKGRQC